MRAIVCIDDTDNRYSEQGTGKLATLLKGMIEEHGWGKSGIIVRHQLFVHPDIPYTSHNSAMSFGVELEDERNLTRLTSFSGSYLAERSLEGSDPGLCVVCVDRLKQPERLVEYGRQAKVKVLAKEHAYRLAEELQIHLSEHGGTGQGVIGALAGAGLRLSGNDGRVRGKHTVVAPNNVASIQEIQRQAEIDLVQTVDGRALDERELVRLGDRVKSVYLGGRSVLLVRRAEDGDPGIRWETYPMDYLKEHY